MALVKCKECGSEVSTKAKACPKCGAEMPKGTGCATWFIAGFAGLVVFSCVRMQVTGDNRASAPQPSPEQRAATAKADADLNRAIAAGRVLKASMKDPSSFKVESFLYFPNAVACYEYRAKNSFGAITPGRAVYNGAVMLTQENDKNNFVKMWNDICTKSGGQERAGGLNLLNAWN